MQVHQEHRILIVDDSFRHLSLMQKLLKSWGYSDCSVNSTEHTLNRLKRDKFDLIIVDKVFSASNELSIAQKIKQIQPGTPVICSADQDLTRLKPKSKPASSPFQKLKVLLTKATQNSECYDIIMI